MFPGWINILTQISVNVPEFGAPQIAALVLAVLCLFISGFVSGSEIAYFSIDENHFDELEEKDGGPMALKFLKNPRRLLATILIANNLVNVTIVVLTNYALGPLFDGMPEVLSFILQTVLLTFLILLFGEILPKLYANHNAEKWTLVAAPGLNVAWKLLGPMAKLLMKSATFVNKVVAKKTDRIDTDELERALDITEGASGDDKEMLKGILRFGDTTASEIMTPRVDITWVEAEMDFDKVMQIVVESGYSRMPVSGESQDDIKGILYARDLLPYIGHELPDGFSWLSLVRQPYYVPESRMIDDLLEDFRRLKLHMAVVVDEYGGTQGIVTLEDVLEEIVGDIDDEYDDTDKTFKRLPDDTFIFEGRTPLTDFFRITGLDEDDYREVSDDVETLAGMLLAVKGDFPKEKEPLVYGRCRFLILDIEDHRIAEVRVKVMPREQEL